MIVGVLTTCHTQYTSDRNIQLYRWNKKLSKVFFYDVRCAVVMHFSAWSAVYKMAANSEPLTCYKLFGTIYIVDTALFIC